MWLLICMLLFCCKKQNWRDRDLGSEFSWNSKGPTLRHTTTCLYYKLYIFDNAGHLYRHITIIRKHLFVLNCSSIGESYSPLNFWQYLISKQERIINLIFIYIFYMRQNFSIWKSFTSHLHVLCLTYHLNTWVNIYVDVIHDVTVMLMFVMLIARIYNCQWHEWI